MGILPRAFALAVTTSLLLALCPRPASAQFGGDRPTGTTRPSHVESDLRVSGEHMYLGFTTNEPGYSEPRLVSSHDAGKTWGDEIGFGDLSSMRFDADGEIVVAVANDTVGGHGGSGPDRLFLFSSQDGGSSFSERTIHTSSYWDWVTPPTVRVQGLRADVFWGERDPGASVSYYQQTSFDGGVTWLPAPIPSIPVAEKYFIADGTTFHSFRITPDPSPTGYEQIEYRRSNDGGLSWTPAVRLDSLPNDRVLWMKPELEDGVLSLAWRELEDVPAGLDHADAYLVRSTDGGVTWSSPYRLNSNFPADSGDLSSLGFAMDGSLGVVAFTFNENPGPNIYDLYVTTTNDAGASWTTPERLNPIASTIGRPMSDAQCMATGDGLYVTWVDAKIRSNGGRLVASWSFDQGTTWRSPEALRSVDEAFTGTYITADDPAAGCLMTVWTDNRTGLTELHSNGGCLSQGDAIACRAGNVNAGAGSPVDILRVNGQAGSGATRRIDLTPSETLDITLDRPPSLSGEPGPLPYVLYTRIGVPDAGTVRRIRAGIGDVCMPIPFTGGIPQPTDIFNTWGFVGKLGESTRPTREAPGTIVRAPGGVGREVVFWCQALVPDPASPSGIAAVTNGLEVHVE